MTCLSPINTNWSMRPERTRIGISKWYYTERMEQPWRITSKDHHMILSVDFSTTLWYVWSCMRWKMKSHVSFSCAQRHKASWPRYIATTGFKLMHIVTITEDDNLMSNFGRAKWRRCIRSASDCVFFAGPCTGGSPWNRLNKNVSDVTAHNIRMKALLYWELWEEFALCLQHVHERFAMALLELPRGCDYSFEGWRIKCCGI